MLNMVNLKITSTRQLKYVGKLSEGKPENKPVNERIKKNVM